MLFVTLPFLLALWEYNLINIVERMSVEKKNAYIGVDLGGTNMRAGRIVGDRLVAQGSAPTPKDAADCEETLEALIEVIRSVWDESVVAIGIGVPSVVDREKGIVYNVVNIPHWEEVHLKEILEACFSVPVYVDNDANCFALGERIFGEGKTVDELFEESMYEDLKDFAYPNSIKNLKIRFSKLENPGLFGAASLCYDK